jgi:hypothetical protein
MPKPNLQTVIVSKEVAPTREEATEIAREYANRIYTSRQTESSWRFRQRPPDDFKKGSFRTFKVPGVEGVSMVYGDLKARKPSKRKKKASKKNPSRKQVRNWDTCLDDVRATRNLQDLAKIAAQCRPLIVDADSSVMLRMFDSLVAARATQRFGWKKFGSDEEITLALIEEHEAPLFIGTDWTDNPGKPKRLRNPRSMPDPGAMAWLGDLLEWAWLDRKGEEFLWEPDGRWAFMWSPMYKAVIAIPTPDHKSRLEKVSRKDGAAKLFERFTARDAENTYKITVPKAKLHKLGKAKHIVYRSDKWNPGKNIDYIHDFKDGVELYCGPNLEDPQVFLCFGGKLTCTERGLVW